MWNDNAFTRRLGIRFPIIQGPFGGGLSTAGLTATVSNLGGLGSFGAHLLSPAQIHTLTNEIRRETSRPFALNLWVSSADGDDRPASNEEHTAQLASFQPFYEQLGIPPPPPYTPDPWSFEDQAAAVIETRPSVFSFVFGIPSRAVLDKCRERQIMTIGAATTLAESLALERAGVDAVVATGFEAGGHRPSFLRDAEDSLMGTLALVPQVADRLKIPVIAAGGIVDARGAAAALTLGAQAVQLGTAFLACSESGTSDLHRTKLFGTDTAPTQLSRRFTGRLARFMTNHFLEKISAHQAAPLPYPRQSWFTTPIKQAAAALSRPEYMALYASQATPLLRHRHAADLMNALTSALDETFSSRPVALSPNKNASFDR